MRPATWTWRASGRTRGGAKLGALSGACIKALAAGCRGVPGPASSAARCNGGGPSPQAELLHCALMGSLYAAVKGASTAHLNLPCTGIAQPLGLVPSLEGICCCWVVQLRRLLVRALCCEAGTRTVFSCSHALQKQSRVAMLVAPMYLSHVHGADSLCPVHAICSYEHMGRRLVCRDWW